ncbi:MAG: guanylate kinase [bacterium]|nr:guanylate kinase [bacterium]
MNNIIVVSGPSGCGKSTLISMLLKEHPDITFSVSHTTRTPRENEVDGEHYYFTSRDRFVRMAEEGGFAEWALVHGRYYGTSLMEIDSKSSGSKFLVLDIDVQGARILRPKFPEAVFVLISPPSFRELEKRLSQREHGINLEFEQRLKIAKEELGEYSIYDYIIINDELRKAYGVFNSIYTAYKNTMARNEARIIRILESV